MINLIRDPNGESVMGPSISADKAIHIPSKPTTEPASQHDEVVQLKRRVLELEKKLQYHGN